MSKDRLYALVAGLSCPWTCGSKQKTDRNAILGGEKKISPPSWVEQLIVTSRKFVTGNGLYR